MADGKRHKTRIKKPTTEYQAAMDRVVRPGRTNFQVFSFLKKFFSSLVNRYPSALGKVIGFTGLALAIVGAHYFSKWLIETFPGIPGKFKYTQDFIELAFMVIVFFLLCLFFMILGRWYSKNETADNDSKGN